MAGEAPHLSIGEVLAELRDEFPDITISKIRFLESQGLIDPERTPSGYRKFYDTDLTRLRWILKQQKEHFLPLKVIKERLDALGPSEDALLALVAETEGSGPPVAPEGVASEGGGAGGGVTITDIVEITETVEVTETIARTTTVPVPPTPAPPSAGSSTRRRPRARTLGFSPELPDDVGDDSFDPDSLGTGRGDGFSREEVAEQSGLEVAQIEELEGYALLVAVRDGPGGPEYEADAIEIAQAASAFFARGVEARHLRMYRTMAEREAVLFGQVLLPYVRQRNPEARARLQDELVELSGLGRRLRTLFLREAMRDSLSE